MITFRTKKIRTPESFGKRVRRKRKALGLSLSRLEKISKIKEEHLLALEKRDFKKLPSDVYVRGFIFSLAKILEFSGKEMFKKYKEEKAEYESLQRKKQKRNLFFREEIKQRSFWVTPRIITAVLILVAVLGFSIYFWVEISGFASAPRLQIENPGNSEFKTSDDKITFSGTTDSSAKITLAGQTIPVGGDGKFVQELHLQKGLNLIEIVAESKGAKKTSKIFKIIEE